MKLDIFTIQFNEETANSLSDSKRWRNSGKWEKSVFRSGPTEENASQTSVGRETYGENEIQMLQSKTRMTSIQTPNFLIPILSFAQKQQTSIYRPRFPFWPLAVSNPREVCSWILVAGRLQLRVKTKWTPTTITRYRCFSSKGSKFKFTYIIFFKTQVLA